MEKVNCRSTTTFFIYFRKSIFVNFPPNHIRWVRKFLSSKINENSDLTCLYWDEDYNGWNNLGTQINVLNNGSTICLTNHLTNFTVGAVEKPQQNNNDNSNLATPNGPLTKGAVVRNSFLREISARMRYIYILVLIPYEIMRKHSNTWKKSFDNFLRNFRLP